ncbi:sarcosine oxidase subunit alpha family protein [Actibacterium sp. 188UL27-1]|uniref:sarcosine oxidase subunit alpha family protein n=1 Tax=Actibacterium sp. 188UL27-1 TaxID=2786961 RepID=UPI0019597A8E|nr:sarcosine oxidase subunit alpha family protein [Actibacterium sp. 188UL27-1]MBM7069211.1 sarcosine oxidase subunit alpha family protein [Actibacterium sp. 188UL27-1]
MRVVGKGRVDRDAPLNFTFDGKAMRGFQGDTLASALMANGQKLVGRSFKYHRPRGILTAGSEEPNALMEIGAGDDWIPNTRATVQELYQGLTARSQNRWPSLDRDVLSVNDLFAPFLGAGFYYKTFMWPKTFWEKVYEPTIRKAAGLGMLPQAHDLIRHEKAFAHCDLLVIGAGPTGLMAARAGAEAGADVILIDDQTEPGGRLLSEIEEIDGLPGWRWAREQAAELRQMGVQIMPRTTVTGAYDGGVYGALELVGHHLAERPEHLPLECFWRITARATVLAAGALERPIAFANNDRPGIMMAGAMRSYLHRWGVVPGQDVAVFGSTQSARRTARDLVEAGLNATLIDPREEAGAPPDVRLIAGAQIRDTNGRKGVTGIHLTTGRMIPCDAVAMSGGWTPSVHLTCHINTRPVWQEDIAAFVPAPDAVPGLIAAGACNGTYDTGGCLAAGLEAAGVAVEKLGLRPSFTDLPKVEGTPAQDHPIWHVAGPGRAWLDFQNDVTTKDVTLAAQENFVSVEHMKRYTTQGMAPDQGKNSNIGALAVLADVTGRSIPETGTTTYRPPFVPVTLGAMGAGARGKGFAPERLTTSHASSVARGAPMIEAGLWYRPSYFPQAGETTWRLSCDREVGYVRQAVGICDVSTLGKIDIQGADAGAFLDFIYTNRFSTLKPGRVRYGLMLREDGHVMDDGTTACLGAGHYVMTTTTAAAGAVMAHLEFVRQGLRSDWDVHLTSVSEQWAQFAVAGPKSRDLLNTLLDQPVDNDSFPFMACGTVRVCGVDGRLFRISFSGEHAYEVAVPARYGDSLFRLLVSQAEAMGGGAYGMEALNVLRIEKGFITHAEITGRVTAFDIGMDRMISAKTDCIGKAASRRPGLLDPARERMVGLKPVDSGDLTAGAHLYPVGEKAVPTQDQGYVTSVGYSPTLGHSIGLGFVHHGPERMGEELRMIDALRDVEIPVVICDPVFVDPDGGRARG